MQFIQMSNEIRHARIVQKIENEYNLSEQSQNAEQSQFLYQNRKVIGAIFAEDGEPFKVWVHPDFLNQGLEATMLQYWHAEHRAQGESEKMASALLDYHLSMH